MFIARELSGLAGSAFYESSLEGYSYSVCSVISVELRKDASNVSFDGSFGDF